ncbi:type IV pilus secretin PilQ [Shewanella frigidimarina]|jgi:type IV pilus assembly protein PilQ|uniref:Type IV pilus secretin PilQ n=2 Tax=Shewanella TaxID=22 RepID=Q088S8_SHEFN|nr:MULTISPECIES: type IV pilus secretin PilQ family protein [Shewanella]BAL45894.1 type IV pilus secretin PilQ [Shewanella livingstonensis]ABI70237.1 type IV pilus secretin PilQ [Shewanella frigidimarina NCIMB 400]MBB1426063.1 type IV pilus secretin PilQ family protein [Shewanella sp. SG44-2]RPA31970.1 type IV pilus secretin PilQ family protein [Shewanella frigidimarina]RPA58729.1 type IV pilus secretin PilQ family protein [Shewanella frigidimarina]|tara:strand:- start:647 stop:2695 length:2049 start_codon:yes stop_codon:yes gene_type:complete
MESSAAIKKAITKLLFFRAFLGAVLLMGLIPSAIAANRLMDVKYHSMVDHQLELELIFESSIMSPSVDLSADPAEIMLNFSDTISNLSKSKIPVNAVGVKELTTQQQGGDLQIIVAMTKVKPYQGKIVGNSYRLTINDDVSGPVEANNPFVNGISSIDFRRNKTGGGEILFNLSNRSVAANVEQVGSKLEIKLYNTDIGNDLLYVMDVQDFATPVNSFETFKDDLTARILVDVDGNYDYNYRQDGNVFKVSVDKVERVSVAKEAKKYNGRSLSLNFQNISVRTVLQIIADYNNFNLVTSDTVEGEITLRLDDVPWDQALDLILQTKGLDKRIEGNILMVAPSEELAIRESNDLKNRQEVKELAPLYSEYLQINYAKAIDIAELLKTTDSTLLSSRGSVAVDERTNTLLVKDTAEILENVHRLIEVLDIPIKQVLIEARMVTVKDDVSEDLGIRWGITDQQGSKGTSGTIGGATSIANGTIPSIDDRLNVNLPAAASSATSIAFHVAKLADGTVLDLELSALEQENKGEIIASPRITTSNQKSAYIEQGVEIPYVESASSGATTVTFKKAVLSLRVTPQITPDDRVILDLEITQDSQGTTVATATGEAVAIDTQRIGTQVLVDNGETIVLGGIYQQNLISRVSKVPVLGDIPLVGFLFRNSTDTNERQELLIFVTPKIVADKR